MVGGGKAAVHMDSHRGYHKNIILFELLNGLQCKGVSARKPDFEISSTENA